MEMWCCNPSSKQNKKNLLLHSVSGDGSERENEIDATGMAYQEGNRDGGE